jgi:hypothetical protein
MYKEVQVNIIEVKIMSVFNFFPTPLSYTWPEGVRTNIPTVTRNQSCTPSRGKSCRYQKIHFSAIKIFGYNFQKLFGLWS